MDINWENAKLSIEFVNFIENLFSFKARKNEDIKTEEKDNLEINDKYIWITEDKGISWKDFSLILFIYIYLVVFLSINIFLFLI